MIRVGITGQQGFIGYHAYHTLSLHKDKYTCVQFDRSYFDTPEALDSFVIQCDVIIHLAAMNRHESQELIYATNVELVQKLVDSFKRTGTSPYVLFSSSLQEERDNLYGKSKRDGRKLLEEWASENNTKATGLLIPNVFGPFCKPFYNSFIATFSEQLVKGQLPEIAVDAEVTLIYVADLIEQIQQLIDTPAKRINGLFVCKPTATRKVSDVLTQLRKYQDKYLNNGEIPILDSKFDIQLFNTFRSYIDHATFFPVNYTQYTDNRGSFVEIIRLGIGGQCSFSTTYPAITRGNHFHTRKIERFAVISGKALIQLRKIGTSEVINLYLDGQQPAYVDMPIWYTHNIKNIGEETLYTNFWINEPFDAADPDTFMESV